MKMKLIIFVLMAISIDCYAYRILFMQAISSKSNKINYMPLAEALAAKGHQVTVVNPFPGFETRSQVREIHVESTLFTAEVQNAHFSVQENISVAINLMVNAHQILTKSYDNLMGKEEFRRIIKERDVDLIVIDEVGNDFVLPIADSLQVPFIIYPTTITLSLTADGMEVPKEYAYIPSVLLPFTSNMNFFQRLVNVVTSEIFSAFRNLFMNRLIDNHVKIDFPNTRSMSEIRRDASLCLINHPWVSAYPRPLPPNVIPIGPFHVRPAQPLPTELELLAKESSNGFIVFSLGTYVFDSSMPPHLVQIFQNVFSKLTQRIFWKREINGEANFPSNVVLLNWIPQQDLIAHPNCRLLISLGGLHGLQEAIYHKVPYLGLPFGSDHFGNMARAVQEGYASELYWNQVNEQTLFNAITTLINEPSYRENAARLSKLMRDEILPAKDVAVYWIEHILRHGGAGHLQASSKNLNFIQKHLIDVWLFVAAVLFLLGFLSFMLLRCFVQCLRKPAKEKLQ